MIPTARNRRLLPRSFDPLAICGAAALLHWALTSTVVA